MLEQEVARGEGGGLRVVVVGAASVAHVEVVVAVPVPDVVVDVPAVADGAQVGADGGVVVGEDRRRSLPRTKWKLQ